MGNVCQENTSRNKLTFLEFIATAFLSDYLASEQEKRRDAEELERLQEEIDQLRQEIDGLKTQE